MADHPLRPATDRRLGGPLPRQLANRTRDHPEAVACKQRPPSVSRSCERRTTCGISTPLGVLSPTSGQVSHALLTRSPLYSRGCPLFRVRLACLIHAANVRSEPGSNSPKFDTRRDPRPKAETLTLGKSRCVPTTVKPRQFAPDLPGSYRHSCAIRLSKIGASRGGTRHPPRPRTRTQKLARGRFRGQPNFGGPLPCCCTTKYRWPPALCQGPQGKISPPGGNG